MPFYYEIALFYTLVFLFCNKNFCNFIWFSFISLLISRSNFYELVSVFGRDVSYIDRLLYLVKFRSAFLAPGFFGITNVILHELKFLDIFYS